MDDFEGQKRHSCGFVGTQLWSCGPFFSFVKWILKAVMLSMSYTIGGCGKSSVFEMYKRLGVPECAYV